MSILKKMKDPIILNSVTEEAIKAKAEAEAATESAEEARAEAEAAE